LLFFLFFLFFLFLLLLFSCIAPSQKWTSDWLILYIRVKVLWFPC
jgi:hypothetical protein